MIKKMILQAIARMERAKSHATLQPWHLSLQYPQSTTSATHQSTFTSKIRLFFRQRLASYPPADMGHSTLITPIFDVSLLCNNKDITQNVQDTLHTLALLARMTQTTETA